MPVVSQDIEELEGSVERGTSGARPGTSKGSPSGRRAELYRRRSRDYLWVDVHDVLIALAAFAASAVEMVEALTIVLAVGVTRGWRSAAWGAGTAAAALSVLIVVLGPALAQIPIDTLRVVVGARCCSSSACNGFARRSFVRAA